MLKTNLKIKCRQYSVIIEEHKLIWVKNRSIDLKKLRMKTEAFRLTVSEFHKSS